MISLNNMFHSLATKNSQDVYTPEEEISEFYGENFVPKYLVRHIACFSCALACQKFVQIHDGPYAGEKGMRPEFGPLLGLCSQLGVFDFPFGLKVMNMANQYGIDAEELGPAMAMAFECYQRGILTRKDTDGLRLEWGNQEVILELIRKIAFREGFGDVLADGCLNAAKRIGKGAEKYAYHIKGKSHPDRITGFLPVVLGFAVATRGWDHLRGSVFPQMCPEPIKFWDYDPKIAKLVMDKEHIDTAGDSLEMCKFTTEFELMPKGLGGILGWPRFCQQLPGLISLRNGCIKPAIEYITLKEPIWSGQASGAKMTWLRNTSLTCLFRVGHQRERPWIERSSENYWTHGMT